MKSSLSKNKAHPTAANHPKPAKDPIADHTKMETAPGSLIRSSLENTHLKAKSTGWFDKLYSNI